MEGSRIGIYSGGIEIDVGSGISAEGKGCG